MQVRAIQKGFYVTIREPGDVFDMPRPIPAWCEVDTTDVAKHQSKDGKPGAGKQVLAPTPSAADDSDGPASGPYKAKHIAGGAYVVIDADGNEVGERFLKDGSDAGKAKAAAMAKADELNKALPPADDEAPTGGALGNLPDA